MLVAVVGLRDRVLRPRTGPGSTAEVRRRGGSKRRRRCSREEQTDSGPADRPPQRAGRLRPDGRRLRGVASLSGARPQAESDSTAAAIEGTRQRSSGAANGEDAATLARSIQCCADRCVRRDVAALVRPQIAGLMPDSGRPIRTTLRGGSKAEVVMSSSARCSYSVLF